jgi:hypothetical protein
MTDRLKAWLGEQDGDDLNGSAGHKVLDALRAVVAYCDRELLNEYPDRFAEEIKGIIEREVFGDE